MDEPRFDALTRSLATSSRRRILSVLVAALSGSGLAGIERPIGARKSAARCKKIKDDAKRKKCRKRAASRRKPTCFDGIKNGAETGLDCGGGCPRCGNGQGCATRNDCATAFCDTGTCANCAVSTICGTYANGDCRCYPTTAGRAFCGRSSPAGPTVTDCDACPAGTLCSSDGPPFDCYQFCPAA